MRLSVKSVPLFMKVLMVAALAAGLLFAPMMAGSAKAEVKKLKILSNNPFSGKAASWGFSQDRGVGLAVDKVNKAGGIKINGVTYMWEKISCDNRYIPADAVSCLKRGVAQGAKFMCTLGGAVTKPQIPLINKNKIITIAAIAGGADFTNAKNKYLFRTMPSADLTISIEGIRIYKKLGVKKLVLLTADNVLGHSDAKTLKNALKVNNMSDILVAEEFVPINTGDFTPALTRVLAKNPDHIEGGAWPAAGLALLIKQARELGYKGGFTNLSGAPKVAPLVKIGGKKNVEGVIMLRLWPPDQLPTKAFKEYWATYRKLYKQDPGANSWESYMAFMHLSAAVEKAQSLDPDKIVAAMRDLKIVSLLGELKLIGKDNPLLPGYGINNQYTSPLPVTVMQDGKPVISK